jgi:hypothetical protein
MGRPDKAGDEPLRPVSKPPQSAPPTGVCVLRVQWEGDRLRYRVVSNPDISVHRLEVTRECRDLDDAMLTVRHFLLAFAAAPLA